MPHPDQPTEDPTYGENLQRMLQQFSENPEQALALAGLIPASALGGAGLGWATGGSPLEGALVGGGSALGGLGAGLGLQPLLMNFPQGGSSVGPEKQSSLDLNGRTQVRKQALSQLER